MRSNKNRTSVQAPAPSTPPGLFSGLTADQEKRVLQSAEERRFPANGVILRTGEPASSFYLLTEGRAKYYRVSRDGREVVLGWLATGDSLGIASLSPEHPHYIGTAQAIDDCELLVWSRERIQSLAAANELLARNALQMALYYLNVYIDRLVLTTEKAEHRLAHALLQLSYQFGDVRSKGVELAVKNDDLASLADVSVFTASRQLKEWERQGIIQKSRGKILILSPENLLSD